jgi:hypothetical protein
VHPPTPKTFRGVSFDHWFAAATKGLALEEIKLLRPELHNHYQDALQSQLNNGLNPVDAASKAVASLGDAKQCHRAYHQLYFTEFEYKGLFTPVQYNPNLLSFAIGTTSIVLVFVTVKLIYGIMTGSSNPDFGSFFMALTLALIFASFYLIARRCPSLRWPKQDKNSGALSQPVPQPVPLASISPSEITALRTGHIILALSAITMTFMVVSWSWPFAGAIFGPLYYVFFWPVLAMFIPTIRKLSRFGHDGRRAA